MEKKLSSSRTIAKVKAALRQGRSVLVTCVGTGNKISIAHGADVESHIRRMARKAINPAFTIKTEEVSA